MNSKLKKLIDNNSIKPEQIKVDSRDVSKGDIFFAIKGPVHDGHTYIDQVVDKGASYVVYCGDRSYPVKQSAEFIKVNDTLGELSDFVKSVFNDPSGKLEVYGVTGTNGKTTTVFLIDNILNNFGINCGFISTVFSKSKGDSLEVSSLTTPGILKINSFFNEMISSGKKAAVLEISSHALDQSRVAGINLDSAVFTNITPEHLDYHLNMDNYLSAKKKIFANLKKDGLAVINTDDPMLKKKDDIADGRKAISFGTGEESFIKAKNINLFSNGSEFDVVYGNIGEIRIKTRLIGRHNVYNILGAMGAFYERGIPLEKIKEGVEKTSPVPGRLERLESKAPFNVFVDYAHTPDALENILNCLRSLTQKRLICVFGCGGNRDRTKRPVMGKIATSICDAVFLTNDNPRKEKPRDILKEIEKGVIQGSTYSIIEDRKEAVYAAIKEAKKDDIVVIAGKGHEKYQIIGDRTNHFDDKEEAEEVLMKLRYD